MDNLEVICIDEEKKSITVKADVSALDLRTNPDYAFNTLQNHLKRPLTDYALIVHSNLDNRWNVLYRTISGISHIDGGMHYEEAFRHADMLKVKK